MQRDEEIATDIKAGDEIAKVGDYGLNPDICRSNIGCEGGVPQHLHFEVRTGCSFQDGKIQGCKVIDPYGWEWPDIDPFADGRNPLGAFQDGPLWDLASFGLKLPVVTKVALEDPTSGAERRVTIYGYNFSPGVVVTLWNRGHQYYIDKVIPSSAVTPATTQVVAQLPISKVADPDNIVLKIENSNGPRSRGVVLSGHGAADDHTVLILASTVAGGAASLEATQAASLGATVEIASDEEWNAKSTADFTTYRAIVLGDPDCVDDTSPITAALASGSVWGPAITGNVLLIGSDPEWHFLNHQGAAGAAALTQKGIGFAASELNKTGAYISLSCYYDTPDTGIPVPLLDVFSPGGFTVEGTGGGAKICHNDVHIVARHAALAGLGDADLSNWSCSVHEAFDKFPADFLVLAIARNRGSTFTGSDGTVGTPYILARGPQLVALGLS